MVDLTGKQDRGVPAGTKVSPDASVPCLHNNGDPTPLRDAARLYYQPVCNPQLAPMVKGGCPHRKECLTLHMEQLHGSKEDHCVGIGEEPFIPPVDIDAAFSGLTPRANH
ncbi:MAG: hypothetical protein QG581_485 [Patescibacteria group bacterium]|nr:hypothetical protein [Patescibacteria group bacterium]